MLPFCWVRSIIFTDLNYCFFIFSFSQINCCLRDLWRQKKRWYKCVWIEHTTNSKCPLIYTHFATYPPKRGQLHHSLDIIYCKPVLCSGNPSPFLYHWLCWLELMGFVGNKQSTKPIMSAPVAHLCLMLFSILSLEGRHEFNLQDWRLRCGLLRKSHYGRENLYWQHYIASVSTEWTQRLHCWLAGH